MYLINEKKVQIAKYFGLIMINIDQSEARKSAKLKKVFDWK